MIKSFILLSLFLNALLFFSPKVVLAHPGTLDVNGGNICNADCADWGLENGEYHYHEETGAPVRTLDKNEAVFDIALIDRLKGEILLRVEQNGEAWYLNPSDGLRSYMANGDDGYELMYSTGLGITNTDIEKIPEVDSVETMKQSLSVCSENELARSLKGRILLQVESHGEAWYVYPETCRRIYLQDGEVAFSIMRKLSLGISDVDLAKLPVRFSLEGRFNYCGDGSIPDDGSLSFRQRLCYVTKVGDTLGDLAQKYYGNADRFTDIYIVDSEAMAFNIGSQDRLNTPVYYYWFKEYFEKYWPNKEYFSDKEPEAEIFDRLIPYNEIRSKTALLKTRTILMFNHLYFSPFEDENNFVDGDFVIDPQTGLPIVWLREAGGEGRLIESDSSYDGPYNFIRNIRISSDWKNISYLAETKSFGEECQERTYTGSYQGAHGYQFIVNKKVNPFYSCGWSYGLLTYSPDSTHYAIRNNKEQNTDSDQFIILSDIGNGPYYDFSDSLFWFDNNTLVYRAQNDDVWRVVINHKDVVIFDYLEDLRLEDGKIKFRARHDDQSWSDEEIVP